MIELVTGPHAADHGSGVTRGAVGVDVLRGTDRRAANISSAGSGCTCGVPSAPVQTR